MGVGTGAGTGTRKECLGGAKKRETPQKSYRRDVENGWESGGRRKHVDKRVLVQ